MGLFSSGILPGAAKALFKGENPLVGALQGGLEAGKQIAQIYGAGAMGGAGDISGSLTSGEMPASPGSLAGDGQKKSIFGGAMKDILGAGLGAMQTMQPQQPMGGMVNMPQLPQMGFNPIPQSQFPLRGRGF